MYVGTYTGGTGSEGIYAFRFDDETGAATPLGTTGGVNNPSWLALHPGGEFLYSGDQIGRGGAVSAFAIDRATGALAHLNRRPIERGAPCHISVDATGRYLLGADYGRASVGVVPIAADGSLQPQATVLVHEGAGPHAERQTSPHPHQIVLSPDNRFAFVPDLGTDRTVQYRFDAATGELTPNDPPAAASAPGAGPRHLAFHPNGQWAYVVNELDLTVDRFDYDAQSGTLGERKTVPMAPADADTTGNTAAEIAVHPNGRTLYTSLRGRDEIVAYSIDQDSGELTFLQRIGTGGKTPRFFGLDTSGRWLLACNQNSGSIVLFGIGDDGQLAATGEILDVPAPVCIVFLPQ